jgi:hypothetical protein
VPAPDKHSSGDVVLVDWFALLFAFNLSIAIIDSYNMHLPIWVHLLVLLRASRRWRGRRRGENKRR